MAKITYIPGEIANAAIDEHGNRKPVTRTQHIFDDAKGKKQSEVNEELEEAVGTVDEKITVEKTRAEGVEGGLNTRLQTVEQLAEISIGGGDAQIATGSDFTNPDATKRAKIPTVGAIVDGLNDGVYDVSKRNPTAGPNSDGKFTLDYILSNADTLIPTGWRHGGMTISFVDSSDNKYVQYRLMVQTFSTNEDDWQGVDDNPVTGSKNLIESGGVFKSTNRYITIDADKSIITNARPIPDGFINECYINHKEQSNNDYRIYSIVFNGNNTFTIRLTKGSGLYIKAITKAIGTSVIYDTFHDSDDNVDVKIYIAVDWSKITEDYIFGYRFAVFTDKCYTLENSPIICNFLQKNNIQAIQSDIQAIQSDIQAIQSDIVAYELVPLSTLSVLNNAYMDGTNGGTIKEYDGVSIYYYPVETGKTYKVSSELNWFNVYTAVGFSKNIPVVGNRYEETIIVAKPPVSEQYYKVLEDGYILLLARNTKSSYVYAPSPLSTSLEELQNDVEELQNEMDNVKVGKTIYPLKKNIICSGSSITWGEGPLDSSMVTYVDKYIKERLSDCILATDSSVSYSSTPTAVSNGLLYGGNGKLVSGLNSSVEFDLYGNEIAICQAKRRTTDYGVMKVYADDVEIGTFDNKNIIKSATENFTGESIREIKLAHPYTFNHQIYINGSSTPLTDVVINTNSSSMPTSNCNAWVFRGSNEDGSTCHYIQFAESLGIITSVNVTYDYGKIIAHERSTVGQTDNEYINEYVYGKGNVSYDPDQPTSGIGSGLEFRAIDKRAFFVHKFSEYKTRHFKIEIVGGTNPYFIFNFAVSRYHNLMNAGIGGWKLRSLLYRNDNINHWTQFFKYWHPDVIFEEAMTNDDWDFNTRRISRSIGEITLSELQKLHQLEVHKITYNSSTDKYAVEMCTGIIESVTSTSLISPDIIGTNTQVGDIIRIGNYLSDMHQIVCRKITEVNLTSGEVKWTEPIIADNILMINELSDLIGAEINIRNLDTYKQYYEDLIERVHSVSPNTKIVVVHNGLPNLWTRQLWGYEIVHAELCKENKNVEFVNAQEHIYDTMFSTITGTRKETVVSTGESAYDLSFNGTSYGGWQGFKVLVNGVDVYGKDAYIEMDMAYRLNTNVSGSAANKTDPYDRSKSGWNRTGAALTLHFIRNAPDVGDTIEVQYADTIWSNDFCHVTDFGSKVYGESYSDILSQLV